MYVAAWCTILRATQSFQLLKLIFLQLETIGATGKQYRLSSFIPHIYMHICELSLSEAGCPRLTTSLPPL
jgi:hypothetical protein